MSEVAAPGGVVLSVASVTDRGLVREANEDSLLAEPPVFLVADGMGGYDAGDLASAAVLEAFRTLAGGGLADLASIRASLIAASAGVADVASRTSRGAGSTVTGAVLVAHESSPHWLVLNVGDSRVYRHVGSELEQLTVDHSLGQELVDQGELRQEDLFSFPERNVITRAIGAVNSSADSWLLPVVTGERLLICSDGLHSELTDEEIRATLTMSGKPESAAATLVQRAKAAGGRDNVSVIVIDVLAGGSALPAEFTTGAAGLAEGELDGTTVPVRGE